ncbi:hypothetical protein DB347_07255 [Opitutaceae bacterium EW11]|nr:hypothetical protein DB347_07255 [Opitutaceae bacterium EW11]
MVGKVVGSRGKHRDVRGVQRKILQASLILGIHPARQTNVLRKRPNSTDTLRGRCSISPALDIGGRAP